MIRWLWRKLFGRVPEQGSPIRGPAEAPAKEKRAQADPARAPVTAPASPPPHEGAGVYRRPSPEDAPPSSSPGLEPLLEMVDAALRRVSLTGWEIRRRDTHTWEIADEREPSGTWIHHYTVIAFSSPSGVLVLHGNDAKDVTTWGEGDVGTFWPSLSKLSGGLDASKRLEDFLAETFRSRPPSSRPLAPDARQKPSFKSLLRGRALDERIERLVSREDIDDRFEVERPSPDRWRLIPRGMKTRDFDYDYIVVRTRAPEAVLVFCENQDGGMIVLGRSESAVYVPRDRAAEEWLAWILRNKGPNEYGGS